MSSMATNSFLQPTSEASRKDGGIYDVRNRGYGRGYPVKASSQLVTSLRSAPHLPSFSFILSTSSLRMNAPSPSAAPYTLYTAHKTDIMHFRHWLASSGCRPEGRAEKALAHCLEVALRDSRVPRIKKAAAGLPRAPSRVSSPSATSDPTNVARKARATPAFSSDSPRGLGELRAEVADVRIGQKSSSQRKLAPRPLA